MTRPSLAGIEKRAEVFRLHVPVSRCDTWEHGSSCPGVERCKNCRRRWPCTFITDAEAAFIAGAERTEIVGESRRHGGDYVIRGVQGEFYPCKPDIFEATYEATS